MRGIYFKYKKLETIEDLQRLIEIIKDHKIYLPKPSQLNDPFEGKTIVTNDGLPLIRTINSNMVEVGNVLMATDNTTYNSDDILDNYGVLSLSKVYTSRTLWAHYGINGTGICIGFWADKTFKDAVEVKYIDYESNEITAVATDDLSQKYKDNNIECSLTIKDIEWQHEEEVRYIENIGNDKDKRKLVLKQEDIACLIFGYNTSHDVICMLKDMLISNGYDIPFFKVKILNLNIVLQSIYFSLTEAESDINETQYFFDNIYLTKKNCINYLESIIMNMNTKSKTLSNTKCTADTIVNSNDKFQNYQYIITEPNIDPDNLVNNVSFSICDKNNKFIVCTTDPADIPSSHGKSVIRKFGYDIVICKGSKQSYITFKYKLKNNNGKIIFSLHTSVGALVYIYDLDKGINDQPKDLDATLMPEFKLNKKNNSMTLSLDTFNQLRESNQDERDGCKIEIVVAKYNNSNYAVELTKTVMKR